MSRKGPAVVNCALARTDGRLSARRARKKSVISSAILVCKEVNRKNVMNAKLSATIALLLVLNLSRGATTWCVSPGGSDANTGVDWPRAKQTIQAAVNAAQTGDTVLVTNGVYLLSGSIIVTNAIRLSSLNGAAVTVIDGQRAVRCVKI